MQHAEAVAIIAEAQNRQFEAHLRIQKSLAVLSRFLHLDIRSGFALLQGAGLSAPSQQRKHALEIVRRKVVSVRRRLELVHNPNERARVEKELDRLEQAVIAG